MGPIARVSTAISGTEAKTAAGTSPPNANETAKPTTESGTGAAALKEKAAITVEVISPTATSRPGDAPHHPGGQKAAGDSEGGGDGYESSSFRHSQAAPPDEIGRQQAGESEEEQREAEERDRQRDRRTEPSKRGGA